MAGTFNPGGLNAPPKVIVNWFSDGGAAPTNHGGGGVQTKKTLSGALTANTYKEILAVSGPGVIEVACVYCVDTTSRTMGIKIIVDGITAFDAVCTAVTNVLYGIVAIGYSPTAGEIHPAPMAFNSSLSILIKSSISETDKIGLAHTYYTT
jgi:hypothetical protein